MPLLGGLVVSLFTNLVAAFAIFLTRKVALIAAAIASVTAIVAGVVTAVSFIVQPFITAYPGAAMGVWLFVPDNAGACVTAMLASDATLAVAAWWRANVKWAGQMAA